MRSPLRLIPPVLLPFALAACGETEQQAPTQTKLDAVEVQPGSVSDDMVILDTVDSDGTAIDNSVPDEPKPKREDDADKPTSNREPDAPGFSDRADAVDLDTPSRTALPKGEDKTEPASGD